MEMEIDMQEEAEVLPENKKKRAEQAYIIVFTDTEGKITLKEVKFWSEVKKESNNLPEGCVVLEVLKVTGRFKPHTKTVVQF